MCECVCVITKASGESEAIWGKKEVYISSKLAESQLHVFVLTLVCRDLGTKTKKLQQTLQTARKC